MIAKRRQQIATRAFKKFAKKVYLMEDDEVCAVIACLFETLACRDAKPELIEKIIMKNLEELNKGATKNERAKR